MRTMRSLLVALATVLLVAGCASPPTPAPLETPLLVRVVGSDEIRPLAEIVTEALADRTQGVEVQFVEGNQETGWTAILRDMADIALVGWVPDQIPAGVRVQPLAHDALAIITHPGVGVQALSLEEARDLFSGRLATWEAITGNPLPVILVSREEGSAARLTWERVVMQGRPLASAAVIMPGGRDVVAYVAARQGAVGYVSPALARGHSVHVVALEGVLPSPETIVDGRYPVRRTWYAIVKEPMTPAAQLWLETLQSPDVRKELGRLYAVAPAEPESR